LYLIEEKLWSNFQGGGRALAESHLQLLADYGFEIHVVCLLNCNSPPNLSIAHQFCQHISHKTSSIEYIRLCPNPNEDGFFRRFCSIILDPAFYRMGSLIGSKNCALIQKHIFRIKPTIIWTEDLLAATLAQRASGMNKIVYSHHDWKWQIKMHRSKELGILNWRKRFDLWISKRHEQSLVSQVAGCVSGSISEAEGIRRVGGKNVDVFPTLYRPTNINKQTPSGESVRIVHLGGMQTTANVVGMQRFLQITWPELRRLFSVPPEFWVIGNLNGAPPDLIKSLDQIEAKCTGYVEDLSEVLRPFDIHVIPWEYDTGTRTRIPLVLNFHQVLVSTQAAAACINGLIDGENCILVANLFEMANRLAELIHDEAMRRRIAQLGKRTFLSKFTLHAQRDRFGQFMESFINRVS